MVGHLKAPEQRRRDDIVPPGIVAIADYEALARASLPGDIFAYLAGGAGDEITLRENENAFRAIRLRPRVLRDMTGAHRRLSLFGVACDSPLILAPAAYQTLFHPDGERETALAASAMQTIMTVSTQSGVALEDIARDATAPFWFQLYVQPDRAATEALVRRAENSGYTALVVTVDAQVSGMRNREQRAGFALPPGIAAANLRDRPRADAASGGESGQLLLGGPLLQAAPTWRDIVWLKSLTRLPLLIKGVMTPEDALLALEAGIDGIVVSNHGGRALDTLPPTIAVLPGIAAAIDGRVPVLLDGGIRRGSDIVKAIALGANAVMIGRPYLYGLAAAGAVGVAHVIRILLAELEVTMALTGCRTLDEIGRAAIWTAPMDAAAYGSSSVSQ